MEKALVRASSRGALGGRGLRLLHAALRGAGRPRGTEGLGYDTPFVVVSGKIGEDAVVGMMRARAQDYVTKGNMARLCPAIERELEVESALGSGTRVRFEVPVSRLLEE
jgi:hypothetical protein